VFTTTAEDPSSITTTDCDALSTKILLLSSQQVSLQVAYISSYSSGTSSTGNLRSPLPHISPVLLLPDSANCSLVVLNQLVAIPHVQLFDAATCAGWAFLAICVATVSPLLRLSFRTRHIRASSSSKPANELTVHCATSNRLQNGFFTATNSVTNARLHFSRSLHCNSQPNLPAKPRR
jgi:hypothetical protein